MTGKYDAVALSLLNSISFVHNMKCSLKIWQFQFHSAFFFLIDLLCTDRVNPLETGSKRE